MINKMKEKIIKLRESGKSYREIEKLLKCSKSTISYHCGIGQKKKSYKRQIITKNKLRNKIQTKIQNFSVVYEKYVYRQSVSELKLKIRYRIVSFSMRNDRAKYITPSFTVDEFLEKVGDKPVCYLSGKPIDMNDSRSWSIDHKIPRSRGGNSTLDNAGICDSIVNSAKSNMTIDEFFEVCKTVLEHNGYKVIKDSDNI